MRETNNPDFLLCKCEKMSRVITSWTSRNPGRRFAVCADGGCRFWQWIDKEMCSRSTEIIPGLLKRINVAEQQRDAYEEEVRRQERKVAKLKVKVKELEKEIRSKKWVNKCLVRLFLLTWMLTTIILVSWGKKNGNLTVFRQIEGAV